MCQRRQSLLEISFCFLSICYDRSAVREMLCYVRLPSSWFDYAFYVISVVHQMPHLSCATLAINVKERKEWRSQRKSHTNHARLFQYLSYVVWTTFDCLRWVEQLSVDKLNLALNWFYFVSLSCLIHKHHRSNSSDAVAFTQRIETYRSIHCQWTRHNQVKIMTIIHSHTWICCVQCLPYLARCELNLATVKHLAYAWRCTHHSSQASNGDT
jgi:hypothetical protein